MALVAGIDSSTQSCKVIIADTETARVVREGRASHPIGTEVDPELWWVALRAAIEAAGGFADVQAWAICAQQHGMVLLDAAGHIVRDALLWNDTRSAGAAQDLIAEFGRAELARRTGLVPVASFTITKLRWLRDNERDTVSRVSAVVLPHDWLTWRLRGFGPGAVRGADLAELFTDRSDASGTGYWSDAGYDGELVHAAFGREVTLPPVLAPTDVRDDAHGRSVGVGAGDNAGAALGLGLGVGEAVISIGTSGTVFAPSSTPTTDETGTVAGFADATGNYLPLVATLNAARVLDVAARLLGVDHDELSRLACAASSGAAGLQFLPYLEGERTPDLPRATGSLFGMTLMSTTRENLARAAVEGVLNGLERGVRAISDVGLPLNRGFLIGGGARSRAVCEIAPEVLGLEILVPPAAEYVAWGAARQASAALGLSLPAARAEA